MAGQQEYRFVIDGVNPRTIPASRLLEYIEDVVKVLGGDQVHLVAIEESSAVPVFWVPQQRETRTQQRILNIKGGGGPKEAREAVEQINNRLADDNITARLEDPTRLNILEFPGAEKYPEPSIGPISEQGYVQGEVVQIGGRDDSITVYLRSNGEEFRCSANRTQGRQLAKYIFTGIIRAFGMGHWYRTPTGKWKLQRFDIRDFDQVDSANLQDIYGAVRSRKGDPSLLSDLEE